MGGIEGQRGSVVVRSSEETIVLPAGAFGMEASELAASLEQARAIENRSDVIRRLSLASGVEGGGG